MLKDKHLKIDQEKIDFVKRIFKSRSETEAIQKSLDKVIQENRERLHRRKVVKRMIELRNNLGKIKEESADWVRLAREGRDGIRGSSA